jgi:sugar phosphate isomerase/epimerase
VLIGVDGYSYHRFFGETRPGEIAAAEHWQGPGPVLEHAASLGLDALFLETCYLPPPERISPASLASPNVRLQVAFSWGHPHGLEGGRSAEAEADLRRWLTCATHLGHRWLRITAGSPATRSAEPLPDVLARLTPILRRIAGLAAQAGLELALENHGDLRATELLDLLDRVDHHALRVCLDPVNLWRVGDDLLAGTRLLAPFASVVHLKDCLPGDPIVPGGPISVALGEGTLDLQAILAELAAAAFRGPLCVELGSLGPGHVDERAPGTEHPLAARALIIVKGGACTWNCEPRPASYRSMIGAVH